MRYFTSIVAAYLILCAYSTTANAQIVTIDPTNIVQSTLSAEQAVIQTQQQIQQYKAQLQQLENQIQNTNNPTSFQWSNANNIINQLLSGVRTLNYYQAQAGSVAAYLNKYSNASQYQSSTCLGTGCTTAQVQQLSSNAYNGSDAQKSANDDMLRNIAAQQQQLQSDANDLQVLQQNAQSSTGQMQAIQAANQLASNQSMQLMEIRSLMMTQQTAEQARAQSVTDTEAQQIAAHSDAFAPRYAASPAFNVTDYAQ
jgi:P-type conjugative transfer protein TrbJ